MKAIKSGLNLRKPVKIFLIVIVLSVNIGCDQVSKNIVRKHIDYNERIGLIDNHITITKVENTGAFLSLGEALPKPVKLLFLTILPVAALVITFIILLSKNKLSDLTLIGISFIIGGGLANIYDRAVYGSVIDFLHIDFGLFRTGVFNMADLSIMSGMSVLLFEMYFKRKTQKTEMAEE